MSSKRDKPPSSAKPAKPSDWVQLSGSRAPAMGRYGTLITTGDRLVHLHHETLELTTPAGQRWKKAVLMPASAPFDIQDDRFVNFTAWGDEVWMLGGDGSVWASQSHKPFQRIGLPDTGPGGRYANRIALTYDPASSSLVAFGGIDRNDTWLFDIKAKTWREIRPPAPPPHGIATIVTTAAGIYALIANELWRLHDGKWTCVGKDVPGRTLVHDPKRRRLLVGGWRLGDDKEQAIWAWSAGGLTKLADLPQDVDVFRPWHGGAYLGLDPKGDRLLLMDERKGVFALALGSLPLDPGQLPTAAITPPTTRKAKPPKEWTRPAVSLRRSKEKLASVPSPGVPIKGKLIAILPQHDSALPLPDGYGAVALSAIEHWYKMGDKYQPWRLNGGGYYATLIGASKKVEPCIIEAGVAYRLTLQPYVEIDPAHISEVDTLPDGAIALSYGSKLGGYPVLIQDDPTESWKGAPLRFAAQLSGDLYEVGDWGKTYMWLEKKAPRGYVVTQSH